MAGRGPAGLGGAGQGKARQGFFFNIRTDDDETKDYGDAWHGTDRQCLVGRGMERLVEAWAFQ